MAVQYGYQDLFYHYHSECVKKVIQEPEKYPEYVDMAIAITDRVSEAIQKNSQHQEIQKQGLERAKGTLTLINSILVKKEENNG